MFIFAFLLFFLFSVINYKNWRNLKQIRRLWLHINIFQLFYEPFSQVLESAEPRTGCSSSNNDNISSIQYNLEYILLYYYIILLVYSSIQYNLEYILLYYYTTVYYLDKRTIQYKAILLNSLTDEKFFSNILYAF